MSDTPDPSAQRKQNLMVAEAFLTMMREVLISAAEADRPISVRIDRKKDQSCNVEIWIAGVPPG